MFHFPTHSFGSTDKNTEDAKRWQNDPRQDWPQSNGFGVLAFSNGFVWFRPSLLSAHSLFPPNLLYIHSSRNHVQICDAKHISWCYTFVAKAASIVALALISFVALVSLIALVTLVSLVHLKKLTATANTGFGQSDSCWILNTVKNSGDGLMCAPVDKKKPETSEIKVLRFRGWQIGLYRLESLFGKSMPRFCRRTSVRRIYMAAHPWPQAWQFACACTCCKAVGTCHDAPLGVICTDSLHCKFNEACALLWLAAMLQCF